MITATSEESLGSIKQLIGGSVLSVLLAASVCPLTAFAADSTNDIQSEITHASAQTADAPHALLDRTNSLALLSRAPAVNEKEAYDRIMELYNTYPEGTYWTNENNYYRSPYLGDAGSGCYAFALLVSDHVFGDAGRWVFHRDFNRLRVGDVIRVRTWGGHSAVVLTVTNDGITVVEGAYGSAVHWNRFISFNELAYEGVYAWTRYPGAGVWLDVGPYIGNGWDQEPYYETSPIPGPDRFRDVDYYGTTNQTWAHPWITKASNSGLMKGSVNSDGVSMIFSPEENISRAQALVVLYRAVTQASPYETWGTNATPFQDVPNSDFYTNALNWAYAQGYINPSSTFRPNDSITRAELAKIIWKAAGEPLPSDGGATYNQCVDTGYLQDWMIAPLQWTASVDIISGVTHETGRYLDPYNHATRAQAAKVFVQSVPYLR